MPRQASGTITPIRALVERKRHELTLSMSDLADKADITRSHLYSLLDGSTRDPSVHTLMRLSGALQVPPLVLLRHYLHSHPPGRRGQTTPSTVRSQTTPGDAVAFIPHAPTPDHPALVAPGETFAQTWTLHNVGTVAWRARCLVRLDDELVIARRVGGQLETVADAHLRCSTSCIPVPDTSPGQSVTLTLDLTAPDRSGTFSTLWHLRDEHGTASFPRDFFLQAVVTVIGL